MKKNGLLVVIALNLLALAALAFVYPQPMLSPGPLLASHTSLNTDCFACHAPGRGIAAQRCIACHANAGATDLPKVNWWPRNDAICQQQASRKGRCRDGSSVLMLTYLSYICYI